MVVYFGQNPERKRVIELLNVADQGVDYFVSKSEEEDKLVLYAVGK